MKYARHYYAKHWWIWIKDYIGVGLRVAVKQ